MTATLALICALLAACTVAAPRSAPVEPAQSGRALPSIGLSVVTRLPYRVDSAVPPLGRSDQRNSDPPPVTSRIVASVPLTLAGGTTKASSPAQPGSDAASAPGYPGSDAAPVPLAGGTTYTGNLAWAAASHGPRYLALREPVGTLVEACGPAGCIRRRSTDFGPVLSLWRIGRIADLSAADWQAVCGVPLRFGLCPGSIEILSRRPATPLPNTDTEGSARDGG